MDDIYDPLDEYVNVFRDRFREVAEKTFAELAGEAAVDVDANRETCRQLYAAEEKLSSVNSSRSGWIFWCVFLWLAAAGGAAAVVFMAEDIDRQTLAMVAAAVGVVVIYLCFRVHPKLHALKKEQKRLSAAVSGFKDDAWKQMAPLNRLYDWDVFARMMSRTVPRLEFDPYFTTQRLADLETTYGWDGSFNADRSVLYSHSGLINGNPFVMCRTRKMNMGVKTYTGTKTITWTTREQGSDGEMHTVQHSEVLTATVTAPYPEYFEKTRLIYGNTAAPDLIFHRRQSGLAGKEDSLSFKWKRRSLRRKARNLDNADFAMMTNEDFEVAFNTSDRNSNQQFALLFTPLAQESMMELLEDNGAGYGDDFDFDKEKMINVVIPDHLQNLQLDMNPDQYASFDYDKAEKGFIDINARHFRAIYFSFAPLLCVPMYQQIRPQSAIYGRDMKRVSSFWEHEALANFWGQERFKHHDCVTDCILKTEQHMDGADDSTIVVHAYGYRSERRLSYVSKWGGDGQMHKVPVYWEEYLPVTGSGEIKMKEDNGFNDDSLTQAERLAHEDEVLGRNGLAVYRRHIASKVL